MSHAPTNAPTLSAGQSPRSLRTVLLPAMALVATAAALVSFGGDHAQVVVVTAPPLPTFAARCETSFDGAGLRAFRLERSALAKITRYPFAPADGVVALQRLEEARSCYATARDTRGRERVVARARAWRARVEHDYRDHRIRYERARSAGKLALAQPDIAFLLALLDNDDQPFALDLRNDQRQVESPALAGGEP